MIVCRHLVYRPLLLGSFQLSDLFLCADHVGIKRSEFRFQLRQFGAQNAKLGVGIGRGILQFLELRLRRFEVGLFLLGSVQSDGGRAELHLKVAQDLQIALFLLRKFSEITRLVLR